MKVVDLFSGCGGMSLGFQNEGFKMLAAFDNWEPAVNVYRDNFKHPIFQSDIQTVITKEKIAQFDAEIIIGGPPCQDFSIAGKRELEGKRANLTIRFAEIVSDLKPMWFVMENVYNIEKSPVLPLAVEMLHNAGYGITMQVLDASRCGVPQARHRFFMVGRLDEVDGFLSEALTKGLSPQKMSVHDYLGDSLETDFYYMHPRTYLRRAVFSIYEPSATIRGINRPIPLNYKRHHADKAAIEEGVRALTTKERSYIQTFPKWFQFNGNPSDMELAIGNAVPVNLASYIARRIMEFAEK